MDITLLNIILLHTILLKTILRDSGTLSSLDFIIVSWRKIVARIVCHGKLVLAEICVWNLNRSSLYRVRFVVALRSEKRLF